MADWYLLAVWKGTGLMPYFCPASCSRSGCSAGSMNSTRTLPPPATAYSRSRSSRRGTRGASRGWVWALK